MTRKYFATYNLERIGQFETLEEAQKIIAEHPEFKKSKYTKKGTPRTNYSELKRFAICDNCGDLFYIY